MRPNWFLALRIPADGWYEERVGTPPAGFRRFHGADLHLTLAFLGGCSEAQARCAWEQNGCWEEGPVRATFGEVIPMGNPRRYSALSALLLRGREEVERAMGRCRDRWLEAAEARPDRRPPKAHITFARPQRDAGREVRARGLDWAAALDLGGIELVLDRLVLYTWAHDRRDRLFREVAARELGV
jgi:2'-5' RNA ligase